MTEAFDPVVQDHPAEVLPNAVARPLAFRRAMWRIRLFEEAALRGLAEKLVLGAIHPSIGQEAVAVGVCAHLSREDIILSTHRGHGHALAKGADMEGMMRELFGRAGGVCGGKGGSMHIADFSAGMLGANGVVAANIVIAAGAAHAIKLKREKRIVVNFFGDGAINRGPFLEGLNWAKVFGLPVLFVCEDNGFAATTRTAAMTGGGGPAARAGALGIPASSVDGNDVMAVENLAERLIAELRAGGGPRFLHARTYRLTGHTAVDAATYRLAEEVKQAWMRCPIARIEAQLAELGVDEETLAAEKADVAAEVEAAFVAARDAAFPPAAEAFSEVQDVGDPREGAF